MVYLISFAITLLVLQLARGIDAGKEEFEGRKVLIVGSSAGMGKAAADLVYERGGKIVYSSRTASKLDKIIEGKDRKRAFAVPCDASDVKMVKETVDKAAKLMGGLDGIVWIPTYTGDDLLTPFGGGEGYYSAMHGNYLFNVEYFVRFFEAALPYLEKEESASVVSISSIATVFNGGMSSYGASKAALEAVVHNLAVDFAPKIRVNAFQAGLYDTEIFSVLPEGAKESMMATTEWRIPMQRAGTAEEAGEIIAFMLSHRSSYMTGDAMRADGGLLQLHVFSDFMSPIPKIQKYVPPAAEDRKEEL